MAPRNLKFAGYVLLLTLVACGNDSYTPASGGLLGSGPTADSGGPNQPPANTPQPADSPTPTPAPAPQSPDNLSGDFLVLAESILPETPHLVSIDLTSNTIASTTRFQLGSTISDRLRDFTYHPVSGDRNLEFAGVKPCGSDASCWIFFNPDGSRRLARTLDFEYDEIIPSPDGERVALVEGQPPQLRIYSATGSYLSRNSDFPTLSFDARRKLAWLSNYRLIYVHENRRSFVITEPSSAATDRFWNLTDQAGLQGRIEYMQVSPNGRDVAFVLDDYPDGSSSQVVVLNADTGSLNRVVTASRARGVESTWFSKATWTSDGLSLVIAQRQNRTQNSVRLFKTSVNRAGSIAVGSAGTAADGIQWLVRPRYFWQNGDSVLVESGESTSFSDLLEYYLRNYQ